MTPMIDVVFLLIIFFLCIDFRILEAKLPAYLPKNHGANPVHMEPRKQLRVKILLDNWGTERERPFQPGRYFLEGHRVRYALGPKPVDSLEDLQRELERLKPDSWITDPTTRQRRLVDVVLEPGTGAVYGDVAPCVDAILAAGYGDVHFGGGQGSRNMPQRGR